MTSWPSTRDEGAATVWTLAVGLVTVVIAMAVAAAGTVIVARHRAQAAADLAALAGAARVMEGEEAACARAREIAFANGARLRSCRVTGWDLTVSAEVSPAQVAAVAGSVTATARAGPATARPGPATSRAGPATSRAGPATSRASPATAATT